MGRRAERFEDLVAWQLARRLCREVFQLCQTTPLGKQFWLANQLTRAAASVMANIAEGFDRAGPREFAHFLSMARGSNSEVRSHLYVALDAGLMAQDRFQELQALAVENGIVIGALRAAIQRSFADG
jgi:four helix bundle protein